MDYPKNLCNLPKDEYNEILLDKEAHFLLTKKRSEIIEHLDKLNKEDREKIVARLNEIKGVRR